MCENRWAGESKVFVDSNQQFDLDACRVWARYIDWRFETGNAVSREGKKEGDHL